MSSLAKEKSSLQDIVENIKEHNKMEAELEKLVKISADSRLEQELLEIANEEKNELEKKIALLEEEIIQYFLPKDEDDHSDAILELRPGPGGQEASIFANDMLGVYENYAAQRGWTFTILHSQYTDGCGTGLREAICSIKGGNVFSNLKYESGVHRVQRVPVTESSGRLHTSTMSVVVLPALEEMEETVIPAKDLKIDTFRATGAGGQHVNTTDSAIRITHIPSGIVVSVQNERSQHQNRRMAMSIINAKVREYQRSQLNQGRESSRSSQIGSAERHERIRTYNYPQDRVTDHRLNENFFGIETMLNGSMLLDIYEKLRYHEKQKALENLCDE